MDNMNLETVRNALVIFNTLASIALGVVVWLRKPGVDAKEAVNSLRDEMHGGQAVQDTRLTKIEAQLDHMPTKDDLTELKGKVLAIATQNDAQTLRMDAISRQLSTIHDFLLNNR